MSKIVLKQLYSIVNASFSKFGFYLLLPFLPRLVNIFCVIAMLPTDTTTAYICSVFPTVGLPHLLISYLPSPSNNFPCISIVAFEKIWYLFRVFIVVFENFCC